MGKGALMVALNLDTRAHGSTISDTKCMYTDGDQGSMLNLFDNAELGPMSAVPALGQSPAYIEAKGGGSCALQQSHFQLNFSGEAAGAVGINLQTAADPVKITKQEGPVWVQWTQADIPIPWQGTPGIGVLRTNPNPPSQAPFENISGAGWMGSLLAADGAFGRRSLNKVSLPAAHDAAMGEINNCTTFANARITQTQRLSIAGQLQAGIRYFDIRPFLPANQSGDAPTFTTGHFSVVPVVGAQGCEGESIHGILSSVKAFVAAQPRELVILKFSHAMTSKGKPFDTATQQALISQMKSELGDALFTAQVGEKVGLMTVNQIINGGKRVLCVFDGLDAGLYDAPGGVLKFGGISCDMDKPLQPIANEEHTNFDLFDCYSGTENAVFMMTDQLTKYRRFTDATWSQGEMFLLSFTLTLSDFNSTPAGGDLSILDLADTANPLLWQYATAMFPGPAGNITQPPNLVYVDAVDDQTPLRAALYFNSQVAS
ncbi:hypothetical protein [Acanthopleuribacter pedis]|uniref:Phosphatidylinositol diacylglycerol-lyase n=1 Tax=Acanthopleuribacter pedis TaxID=442870 RepID=A0A8J7U779_9BACT|nr:hypothetical protein [Acanthopleuribacter pedis]MBO1321126.1 hypothetical protein [Acanthopleuribacter pedis]